MVKINTSEMMAKDDTSKTLATVGEIIMKLS
jgi:hypothetical protein